MNNVSINKVELRGRIGTVRIQSIGDRLAANFSLCTEILATTMNVINESASVEDYQDPEL